MDISPEEQLASEINKLTRGSGPYLLPQDSRSSLKALISKIQDRTDLKIWLKDEGVRLPPLELLWRLSEKGYLHYAVYLRFHPEHNEEFVDRLVNLVFEPIDISEDIRTELVISILSYFVDLEPMKGVVSVLNPFLEQVLERLEGGEIPLVDYMDQLRAPRAIERKILCFAETHLQLALGLEEEFEFYDVFTNHTKYWSLSKMPSNIKNIFQQVCVSLPGKMILEEIDRRIFSIRFNWKYLLITLSLLVSNQPEITGSLRALFDSWLREATSGKYKDLLGIFLICSRHCCAESVPHFSSYNTWLGSLSLNNPELFTFFYTYLIQLVPYENPYYLKVQVNKVPSVPASCQEMVTDYVALAKARLKELNEGTDVGIFNDFYESDAEGLEADVRRTIAHFQETKDIPKAVVEASVFRKQYFEKVFIPRLMSVEEGKEAGRDGVVHLLKGLGKVPSDLFRAWKKKRK